MKKDLFTIKIKHDQETLFKGRCDADMLEKVLKKLRRKTE